jgi:hypothetical protein
MAETPTKIRFHYIKSNGFRVVHVDGAHGGITPRGTIFAAIFSERAAIPEMTVHPISAEGTLGEESREERKAREGIVREVEIGLMMDLHAAEGLHQWLGEKIATLKEAAAKASEAKVGEARQKVGEVKPS